MKAKMIQRENEVLEGMPKEKRESKASIDGEMCHMLFEENETLRNANSSLKHKFDAKETENKQFKIKVRDIEFDMSRLKEKLKDFEDADAKFQKVLNSEERIGCNVSEYTSKPALRKMVDELNKECGKSKMDPSTSATIY